MGYRRYDVDDEVKLNNDASLLLAFNSCKAIETAATRVGGCNVLSGRHRIETHRCLC